MADHIFQPCLSLIHGFLLPLLLGSFSQKLSYLVHFGTSLLALVLLCCHNPVFSVSGIHPCSEPTEPHGERCLEFLLCSREPTAPEMAFWKCRCRTHIGSCRSQPVAITGNVRLCSTLRNVLPACLIQAEGREPRRTWVVWFAAHTLRPGNGRSSRAQ